jgi:heme-degrading monooxygenase HmoA
MFYRVTKYNFEDDRFDELLAWGETVRESIEGIDGLRHVDVFRSAPGEGMIVATYESEAAFTAASETVTAVLGDMAQFMTSPPHTHSGAVDLSFGR